MSSLAKHIARIHWLIVPIAAYLVITLALPIANGAAGRADFARHASIVLGACAAAVVLVLTINVLIDLLRRRL
jgi:ABC-type branched-subunit amino acid transport system permease subunit